MHVFDYVFVHDQQNESTKKWMKNLSHIIQLQIIISCPRACIYSSFIQRK